MRWSNLFPRTRNDESRDKKYVGTGITQIEGAVPGRGKRWGGRAAGGLKKTLQIFEQDLCLWGKPDLVT